MIAPSLSHPTLRLLALVLCLLIGVSPALAQDPSPAESLDGGQDEASGDVSAEVPAQAAPWGARPTDVPNAPISTPGAPALAVNPAWLPLLDRLAQEGENRTALEPLFASPALVPDPTIMGRKVRALYKSRFLPKPEPKPGPGGRPLTIYDTWLTPEWVEKIAAFKRANAAVLAQAEEKYGVSASLLTAVFLVETHLGAFLGQRPALAALANLAASTDPAATFPFVAEYEPTREQLDWLAGRQAERAAWALRQLRFFLEYCRRGGFDPVSLPGSLYGAFGLCQFTPGNALKIGVDGNGDGRVDLFDVADAAHSVAAFLKSRGWRENLSPQAKVKVIRQYNNDLLYAQTVLAVAKRI